MIVRSPVLMVVQIGAMITTIIALGGFEDPRWYSATIAAEVVRPEAR